MAKSTDQDEAHVNSMLAEAKRRVFAPPMVWPGDEPSAELDTILASEIQAKQIEIPADDDPLMVAAKKTWPTADQKYLAMIVHRYREMYVGIPEADAIRCILAGFSSPAHAMRSRKLKRRPLKDRAP